MSSIVQLRKDTLTNWIKYDPVLADGEEVLVATDSTKPTEYNSRKVGDGIRKFSLLPMLGFDCLQTTGSSTLFPMSQDATTKAIAAGAQAIITQEVTEAEDTVPSNSAVAQHVTKRISGSIVQELTDDEDKVPSAAAIKGTITPVITDDPSTVPSNKAVKEFVNKFSGVVAKGEIIIYEKPITITRTYSEDGNAYNYQLIIPANTGVLYSRDKYYYTSIDRELNTGYTDRGQFYVKFNVETKTFSVSDYLQPFATNEILLFYFTNVYIGLELDKFKFNSDSFFKGKVDSKLKFLDNIYEEISTEIGVDNSYIDKNGTILPSSIYGITKPILVKKNEEIIFSGYAVDVSVFTKTDAEGNIIEPVLTSSKADEKRSYTYSPKENCYVVISHRKVAHTLYKRVKEYPLLKNKINIGSIYPYASPIIIRMSATAQKHTVTLPKDSTVRYNNGIYDIPSDVSLERNISDYSFLGVVIFNIKTKDFSLHGYTYIPEDDEVLVLYYNCMSGYCTLPIKCYKIYYNNEDRTGDNGAISEYNRDVAIQSHRGYKSWGNNSLSSVLTLGVITDVHGDTANLTEFISYVAKNNSYINNMLCCGDVVANSSADPFIFENVSGAEKILFTLGNHDSNIVTNGAFNWTAFGKVNCYNRYIAPYIENWDITQPVDPTQGKMYYYKDYTSQKVRLIVLDCMYWDEGQKNWLITTLNSAKENNFHVLISTHYPPKNTGISKIGNSIFNTLDYTYSQMDALSAEAFNAVLDFQKQGGSFISWLCGHMHVDQFGVIEKDGYKQLMMVFECTFCGSSYVDGDRVRGTLSENCFNIVSVDSSYNIVKMSRIGHNRDRYLRAKNNFVYNYSTHEVIAHN